MIWTIRKSRDAWQVIDPAGAPRHAYRRRRDALADAETRNGGRDAALRAAAGIVLDALADPDADAQAALARIGGQLRRGLSRHHAAALGAYAAADTPRDAALAWTYAAHRAAGRLAA